MCKSFMLWTDSKSMFSSLNYFLFEYQLKIYGYISFLLIDYFRWKWNNLNRNGEDKNGLKSKSV